MIHGLELPIQAQDLVKAHQTSTCFCDIYHYITDRKLPSGAKAQACIQAKALNYVVINNFLFRIDTRKNKDIVLTKNNYVPLMQAQISLCAKIGYMLYCEYAHLLKKRTEHTCMSVIYYDQSSQIKADRCKMIVTFDTLLESKILDAGNTLILSNLQKPWTTVCKDVDRTFELKYSTYHILNRSELCKCSLTAGNYLLSLATSHCGDMPEVKDGFFTTYYAFNRIVLDVLTD